jgi:hypothetical protein
MILFEEKDRFRCAKSPDFVPVPIINKEIKQKNLDLKKSRFSIDIKI